MVSRIALIGSIAAAVFASSGFWAFLTFIIQRRDKRENAEIAMMRGLGHDRICHLGTSYIKRGYITRDEYENLHTQLFVPYQQMGGNGTAKKIMREAEKLPMRE